MPRPVCLAVCDHRIARLNNGHVLIIRHGIFNLRVGFPDQPGFFILLFKIALSVQLFNAGLAARVSIAAILIIHARRVLDWGFIGHDKRAVFCIVVMLLFRQV